MTEASEELSPIEGIGHDPELAEAAKLVQGEAPKTEQAEEADSPEGAEQVEQPESASEDADDSTEPTKPDEGSQDGGEDEKPDVSWAPGELKTVLDDRIAAGDFDSVESLETAYKSMQSDYVAKTQRLAEMQRKLDADAQEKADKVALAEAILANEKGRDFAGKIISGELDEDFDPLTASGDDLKRHIEAQVERKLAEAQRPAEELSDIHAAIKHHFDDPDTGVQQEVYEDAIARFSAWAEDLGWATSDIDPGKWPKLIAPHLEAAKAAVTVEKVNQEKSEVTRAAKAISPVGRGSAAPKSVPAWKAEDRVPTADELIKLTMSQMRERGVDLNTLDN